VGHARQRNDVSPPLKGERRSTEAGDDPHGKETLPSSDDELIVPASASPLLEVQQMSKAFGGAQALTEVDLTLERGTVHAVVGHNGAGKSTLMKILSGVVPPDTGRLLLNGEEIVCRNPREAQTRGISMVHQELTVLDDLDVAENIFLGREPVRGPGLSDRAKLDQMAKELLLKLDLEWPARTKCSALSVGEKQMVEIARAISWDANVLILDEPTSALSQREQHALFELIEKLKASGLGILYISHRLDEILQLADTVTVLRDGKNVGELHRGEFDHAALIETMIGRVIEKTSSSAAVQGEKVLEITDLHSRSGRLNGINLAVSGGEIVGLAGMLGSGRSELFECMFGLRRYESGTITINGAAQHFKSPIGAMAKGIGLVPEDRKEQGIFAGTALWKNMMLASVHDLFARLGFVTEGLALQTCQEQAKRLDIRFSTINQDIGFLSGGNQQKAILARWILRDPRLLLLDDPTAGIDVGAKSEIHALIGELASQGVAILVSSSEFDELIGLCHRILVIRDGRIVQEVDGAAATEHALVLAATGGRQ
jgi:ABC-type sugar transport system ATPase subunit